MSYKKYKQNELFKKQIKLLVSKTQIKFTYILENIAN